MKMTVILATPQVRSAAIVVVVSVEMSPQAQCDRKKITHHFFFKYWQNNITLCLRGR